LVQTASLAPAAANVSSEGAGKGPALGGDIRLVVHEKLGQHLIDVLFGAGAPQRFLDHHTRAEADRRANGLLRNRGMAAAGEGVVQGIGEVRRGVDEGAVEIENDRRIRQMGEGHVSPRHGLHVDPGRAPRHISFLALQG